MRYFVILFLFLFFSCTEKSVRPAKVFAIQPFGDFSTQEINSIHKELNTIRPGTVLRKSHALPENAFYKPRNRYRADSLITWLNAFGTIDTVVIGLTNKDISITKENYPDWGVMGYGYCPGNACVVSTFRLSKEKLSEQFFKLCVHELGHTEGLPHCPQKTCYMRDAGGGNPLDEEKGFCDSCKSFLVRKGWKLG